MDVERKKTKTRQDIQSDEKQSVQACTRRMAPPLKLTKQGRNALLLLLVLLLLLLVLGGISHIVDSLMKLEAASRARSIISITTNGISHIVVL